MDEKEPKHKRRVGYKGTHTKAFNEKYKELQPKKYADTVAKVIQKCSTSAGMHRSICINEILEFLQITLGQTGLDATLDYGGHTLEMLKCLDSKGLLYVIDVDSLDLHRCSRVETFTPERSCIQNSWFVYASHHNRRP